jgi:hypothetical protein
LEVPLDYSNQSAQAEQAAIAIVRYRSPYPKDDHRYRGPVLFNPGELFWIKCSYDEFWTLNTMDQEGLVGAVQFSFNKPIISSV